jgi:hypothetical protein
MLYQVTVRFQDLPKEEVLFVETGTYLQAEAKALTSAMSLAPKINSPYVQNMSILAKSVIR